MSTTEALTATDTPEWAIDPPVVKFAIETAGKLAAPFIRIDGEDANNTVKRAISKLARVIEGGSSMQSLLDDVLFLARSATPGAAPVRAPADTDTQYIYRVIIVMLAVKDDTIGRLNRKVEDLAGRLAGAESPRPFFVWVSDYPDEGSELVDATDALSAIKASGFYGAHTVEELSATPAKAKAINDRMDLAELDARRLFDKPKMKRLAHDVEKIALGTHGKPSLVVRDPGDSSADHIRKMVGGLADHIYELKSALALEQAKTVAARALAPIRGIDFSRPLPLGVVLPPPSFEMPSFGTFHAGRHAHDTDNGGPAMYWPTPMSMSPRSPTSANVDRLLRDVGRTIGRSLIKRIPGSDDDVAQHLLTGMAAQLQHRNGRRSTVDELRPFTTKWALDEWADVATWLESVKLTGQSKPPECVKPIIESIRNQEQCDHCDAKAGQPCGSEPLTDKSAGKIYDTIRPTMAPTWADIPALLRKYLREAMQVSLTKAQPH